MKRCLSERALLRVYSRDGTAAEREHLQLCPDCAERYDALAEDLSLLQRTLEEPEPAAAGHHVSFPFRLGWVPVAAAAAALLALIVGVQWLRQPMSGTVQVASRSSNVSAFAADVSAALFANNDARTTVALASNDAPYLQAALDAGSPCTRDRYLNGECDDQLSALILESD
jgi:hypothetical protein